MDKTDNDWKNMYYKQKVKFEDANRCIERLNTEISKLKNENMTLSEQTKTVSLLLKNVNELLGLKIQREKK